MQSIERLVGYDFAINAFTRRDDPRRLKLLLTLRAPDPLMREYAEHYSTQDTWLLRHRTARFQEIDWTREPGSEFKSWVRTYGLRFTVGISDLPVSSGEGFVLALHRQGMRAFSEPETDTLSALFPHLHNLAEGVSDPVSYHTRQIRAAGEAAGLTPREHEVAFLLAARLRTDEIAEQLRISRHTVEKHVEHIYGKVKASGRAEARKRLLGEEPQGLRPYPWRRWLLLAR